ncbi:hypothetical protein [uncultured Thiothrix sp.]|uniref:hypothetical protein n=1 Tax=uncultured Thiothrix sp. TaxID=223185 RepID=UPI00262F6674|nr:hypothetical protein [uncultured Thiothrix sp.]
MTDSADFVETIEGLWPSPEYFQFLERLKNSIGSPVYLAEINITAINLGVKLSSTPLTLLAIVDFPRPDPYKQLCPHMLIFDDGRGINLGHIARISLRAFNPEPQHVLYSNRSFNQEVLFAPRILSRDSIRATSSSLLAEIFGDIPGRLLAAVPTSEQLPKPKQVQSKPKRLK